MKTLFCLLLLAGSAFAQIPENVDEALLTKLYGRNFSINYGAGGQIKSIGFFKKNPQNFHGGECFCLILEVLRGRDGAELTGDNVPGIKVTGDQRIVWHDLQTGNDIDSGEDGFTFVVTNKGRVVLKAHLVDRTKTTEFVLTPQ